MSAPDTSRTVITAEVAIVGAGPAGLAAATQLGKVHGRKALVLDRESRAGGIPRHCDHPGYGIRDLHTFIGGPAYAERLVREAKSAGADIMPNAMVTAVHPDGALDVTSPAGLLRIESRALVLATGARERARPARMIPGDRPSGVYTTGQLQNIVHLHHGRVGTRAVVVGGELVSWSAVMTLKHAGCRTVLMTTQHPSPESYAAFTIPGKALFRFPIATRTRVVRDHRPRESGGGRDRESRHRRTRDRRVRHRRLHRRLDPGPRTRAHGGYRHRPRNEGTAGRHRPAHQPAGRLRRGQRPAPGRHRRHRSPRRHVRRRPGGRVPRRRRSDRSRYDRGTHPRGPAVPLGFPGTAPGRRPRPTTPAPAAVDRSAGPVPEGDCLAAGSRRRDHAAAVGRVTGAGLPRAVVDHGCRRPGAGARDRRSGQRASRGNHAQCGRGIHPDPLQLSTPRHPSSFSTISHTDCRQ